MDLSVYGEDLLSVFLGDPMASAKDCRAEGNGIIEFLSLSSLEYRSLRDWMEQGMVMEVRGYSARL